MLQNLIVFYARYQVSKLHKLIPMEEMIIAAVKQYER